jgi:hypothetical protein
MEIQRKNYEKSLKQISLQHEVRDLVEKYLNDLETYGPEDHKDYSLTKTILKDFLLYMENI